MHPFLNEKTSMDRVSCFLIGVWRTCISCYTHVTHDSVTKYADRFRVIAPLEPQSHFGDKLLKL